jgi:hypothetical protein
MKTTFCVLAILLAAAPDVNAQSAPSDSTRSEARERFARGLHLFENGDNGGALAEFKRAYEVIPNRFVLYNLGLVYASMDRPVEAVDTLEKVLADVGPLKPENVARAREVKDAQAKRIGLVEIQSNVPATIELDGISAGQTPLAAPLRVSVGAHVVGLFAHGYLPTRREITVAGGVVARVAADLQATESSLAHVEVRCPLPGAEVFLDGVLMGKTPLASSLTTVPGTRAVELRRPGYITERRDIALADGARGELSFELGEDASAPPALLGGLRLLVDEGDISLTVDGRKRGVYRDRLALPVGPHRLRLERAGFEPLEREIQVEPTSDAIVKANLRPTLETREAYVSHARSYRTWSYVTLAAGVLVAGGSGTLAYVSNSRLSTANGDLAKVQTDWTRYAGGSCDHSLNLSDTQLAQCQQRLSSAQDNVSKWRNLRTTGIVGAAVGGAAIVGGVVLLLLSPDPTRYDAPADQSLAARTVVLPVVVQRGGALLLSGRF